MSSFAYWKQQMSELSAKAKNSIQNYIGFLYDEMLEDLVTAGIDSYETRCIVSTMKDQILHSMRWTEMLTRK